MSIYFNKGQLILEIRALPGLTTFYHYLLFRLQTMTPRGQVYVEAFVDYCTSVYNVTHQDSPAVRTDDVLNALDQLNNLDRQHLKKLSLLPAAPGGV